MLDSLLRRVAAVDAVRSARHKRRLVTGQERDNRRDLDRFANTPDWKAQPHSLCRLPLLFRAAAHALPLDQRRFDGAPANAVHAQLWWAVASLVLIRLLRRDSPRLWLVLGLVGDVALLTKLTILFFGLALVLALLVTPERRYLRTPWPWFAGGIAFLGLLPYLIWNALNDWPTVEFWHNYVGLSTSPLDFFSAQVGQMNPVAVPLAGAGLCFYFRGTGARYRLLGWAFVFVYLVLTVLRTKPYFLAPAYPIVFAAGAVVFERVNLGPRLAWLPEAKHATN